MSQLPSDPQFPSGYCLYRFDGTQWVEVACNCATGYKSPGPPVGKGQMVGSKEEKVACIPEASTGGGGTQGGG